MTTIGTTKQKLPRPRPIDLIAYAATLAAVAFLVMCEDNRPNIRAALDRELELADEGVRAFPDKPTFITATAPTKWRCSPHGNTVIQDAQPTINCKDSDRAGCEWSRLT